jgi:hypothetical protein
MPASASGCRANTLACAIASAAVLSACAASPPAPRNVPPVEARWRQHRTTINYYGLTTLYSCSGFEDKVRMLLLYLGARPDLKVQAAGCDRGFDRPGHLSAVNADFYTLSPSSAAPGLSGAVTARWQRVTVKPMVPFWMGFGECELLQRIKPVVTADFSTQDLHYRTACLPYDATISDYELSGRFLKPAGTADGKQTR